MKGRLLILIFLFLISFSSAVCEVNEGSLTSNVLSDTEVLISYNAVGSEDQLNALYIQEGAEVAGLHSVTLYMDYARWSGSEYGYGKSDVVYRQETTTVGTGYVYYWAMNTDEDPGYDTVYIKCYFDDGLDIGNGKQLVFIDGDVTSTIETTYFKEALVTSMEYDDKFVGMGYCPEYSPLVFQLFTYESNTRIYKFFHNDYNWWHNEEGGLFEFNITRDVGNTSMIKIINSGGIELINETSLQSASIPVISDDLDNSTWYFSAEDNNGVEYARTFEFTAAGSMTAEIEFNQTYYTDPELVYVDYEITNMDTAGYEYWVEMLGTNDGLVWVGVNAGYNDISVSTGQVELEMYPQWLTFPMTIKTNLYTYNKFLGTETILATTNEVMYNLESMAPGSIWTEKSTYNISEIFYIEFETEYPTVDIELISDTYHDIRTMEGNGHGHLGYAFKTPHNFTAYLYEDGIKTNQTSFSVAATDPMLNIFLDSEVLKKQFALEYYTDNSSDTITGYKPDGSTFYGPFSSLETSKITVITGISSSTPPGVYTLSLLHDGTTYYNDTIELYYTSEYVSFEASKYETGDRIKIYSYVTDSRQQVRLTDSIGTAVITWTDSAGYIVPNGQTVLYFSLTDNNEYGLNINSSIDAGTFRTGNWKVEIIGIDGRPLTNESTHDYTTVTKRIETPADASNEMISILFSPEGLFMIFAASLTMMGLVAAKHPAGGAAGACVGVGFGVYFQALPTWMLLLMVIALVVSAGVSVAVHFQGK